MRSHFPRRWPLKTPASEFNVLDRSGTHGSLAYASRTCFTLTVERIHRALKLTDACMRRAGYAEPHRGGGSTPAGDGGNLAAKRSTSLSRVTAAGMKELRRKGRFRRYRLLVKTAPSMRFSPCIRPGPDAMKLMGSIAG